MTMEKHRLQYGGQTINFALVRRKRATLEIAVEPNASVVVTAPFEAPIEVITKRVQKRSAWIRRQQRYFAQFSPRTPVRHYVAGETHLYLGRHYRLKVVPNFESAVNLFRGFIVVRSDHPERTELTRDLLHSWYRDRAHVKFAERLESNLLRFADPEALRPNRMIVRKLRQRWGSMSPTGRLLLNLRLIEAPVDAIDYVITHELCHIAKPHHSPAFFRLLDRVLPDWQRRKERLERVMA